MMAKKVIIVVTNESKFRKSGDATGWFLPEVAHPYDVFTDKGYEVVFISPKGGLAPLDPGSADLFKDDKSSTNFQTSHLDKLKTTLKAEDIKDPQNYSGLFYAGGHGPMFDLPENAKAVAQLGSKMYNMGKILGAVCHGVVGFVPITVSRNGKEEPLVKGHTVTSFTNKEEDVVQRSKDMPFMLETRLIEQGATFKGANDWANNVQVCGQLVTGQNPASASDTAKRMVELMEKLKK